MKRLFHHIKRRLSGVDIETLAAYQHKQPDRISVSIVYDSDHRIYTARVIKLDGKIVKGAIVTEAKSVDDLVEMINDAVFTYLDFPEDVKLYVPRLLPVNWNLQENSFLKKNTLALAK